MGYGKKMIDEYYENITKNDKIKLKPGETRVYTVGRTIANPSTASDPIYVGTDYAWYGGLVGQPMQKLTNDSLKNDDSDALEKLYENFNTAVRNNWPTAVTPQQTTIIEPDITPDGVFTKPRKSEPSDVTVDNGYDYTVEDFGDMGRLVTPQRKGW